MQQLQRFESIDHSLVCKLNKALYGLKQAPQQWLLNNGLKDYDIHFFRFGFKASKCDPSLFVHTLGTAVVYLLVYVDVITITGNLSFLVQTLIGKLDSNFSLKHLGPLEYFLSIEVKYQASGSVYLTQGKYIRDLLTKLT
uniref:Retrovirus-related Pol polyprotein from transposon TNT 1-94 n=1 Tax=Cajanus cajan TaxID=3821 RepID=A0A151UAP9_CAJCA|nr:Retrovirus-related Pol polyprotein from transposon TNT 1-94 [Cajanus cajan]